MPVSERWEEKTKRHISRRVGRLDDDDAMVAVIIGGVIIWIVAPGIAMAVLPDLGDLIVMGVCFGMPLSLALLWLFVMWCALTKRVALEKYRQWQNSRLFVKEDETDD